MSGSLGCWWESLCGIAERVLMTIEMLNEAVKVRADFKGGTITPLAFKRNGKTFRVQRVNARWEEREGQYVRYCFSVEAEGNVFELHLDSRNMSWRLDRVYVE